MQSLFGTDGIRGKVTSGFFSTASLIHAGAAIGRWACARHGHRPTLIIGYDTRYSAQHIKQALIEGLTQVPVDILDAHIIPTPAAAHLLQCMPHVAAAIIISASHNDAQDNGIKLFDQKIGKLTSQDELDITRYYHEESDASRTEKAPSLHGCVLPLSHASATYVQHLYTEIIKSCTPLVPTPNYHVVLDVAYGAMAHIATQVFEKCGAKVTTLHSTPDGYNINQQAGSTDPRALQAAVIREKADLGFAFDGDGDRVVAVNKHGQLKNGDDLLYLLLTHPDYAHTPSVVGTIMTNGGLEHALAQQNKTLLRTPVGDRFIMDALNREKLLLGGEPVGHIILRNHLYTGDGLLVALKILETIAITSNWDMTTFTHYAQASYKLPIEKRPNLTNEPFAQIIQNAQELITPGRVLVRYSGTEPVLRITTEAEDVSRAHKECGTLVDILQNAFKELP